MQYRPGKESDFDHLETFVWQAIFPGFDVPGLSDDQRAENDELVAQAKTRAIAALNSPDHLVLTAWDNRRRNLVGYLILALNSGDHAEVVHLIVKRGAWGSGVGKELLEQGVQRLRPGSGLRLAVRPYNQRAIAFFTKHGFIDTGEAAGDAGIDRIHMVKAAEVVSKPEPAKVVVEEEDDFPTAADEPYYEELPDYRLAADDWSEPVFDPEQSTLDEEQFNQLEDFITRAKARKAGQAAPITRHPEIELEIDYGESTDAKPTSTPEPTGFTFAFDYTDPGPASPPKDRGGAQEQAEETLELDEIPEEITVAKLRGELEDGLGDKLTAYFGADALPDYLEIYRNDDNFHRIRDVSLASLSTYLNGHDRDAQAARRRRDVLADLTEYFMVESGAELHEGLFPQKLLRFQGLDWKKVDLFRLVMAYLDFDRETESVYTDFVTMPPRVLKNATSAYLRADRDERVLFICDQSIFGNGKQGFAMTDSGVYWKNVLQPPGAATYTTVRRLGIHGDHLMIDGQYFDAGRRLNLRVALLLDKLRRMDLSD
ncbi:ribosomal protein S18 acetylase RimI-like enzyme [Lewinella aquimaris]|uniref:Ribosomal protein S18 acetylase RimI-like enzyme n=1 Tax=Neolewinella aquimaris TaxID=1835722 RepID=A0A840E163_9BACT|nr:GNAT family N-acetyltransferase [Neolewinella aquimaris]MBB4077693.1 ribosomal protein S18 acetylase RimI-like enzyme [Neolewinella aquimaris]